LTQYCFCSYHKNRKFVSVQKNVSTRCNFFFLPHFGFLDS